MQSDTTLPKNSRHPMTHEPDVCVCILVTAVTSVLISLLYRAFRFHVHMEHLQISFLYNSNI